MLNLRRLYATRNKLVTLNVICWSLFVFVLVLPAGFLLRYQAQSGGFRRVPDVQFVYFYSMGRLFDRYPAAQVYDYQVQKKVCTDVRKSEKPYGPIAYAPFLGILLQPFSRLPFLTALCSWASLSFCLYLTALFLAIRGFFHGPPSARSLVFCFALSIQTFWVIIASGHLSMIGFFCFSLAFYEQTRRASSFLVTSGMRPRQKSLVLRWLGRTTSLPISEERKF